MDKEIKEKEIKKEPNIDKHHDKENKKEIELTNNLNTALTKITELTNALSVKNDEAIRSKADLVNYRKRKDEEVSKMLKYANEDLIKELIVCVDSFERAIKLDDDNLDDSLSKFLDGFKMIYCNIVNILESYGVKAIDGANKPFDPTYHQAVLTTHEDSVEPGMVLEVLQKGYLLKDKVIRPAMVRVSE